MRVFDDLIKKAMKYGAKKKKKNDGIIEVLLNSPWQVSVIFSIVAFILLRWIIPTQFSRNPYLATFGSASKSAAPFTLLFLIPGLLGYIKQMLNKSPDDLPLVKKEPSHSFNNTVPNYSQNKLQELPKLDSIETPAAITEWSLSLLKEMEWKRFELLCAEYFRCLGKHVETINHGADGGIDARIFSDKTNTLEYAIQCKSWNSLVGIKSIRELYGVISHEAVGKGILMTTSDFTEESKQFATDHNNKLFLINGEKFVSMLLKLPESSQKKLLAFATEGDYKTPSCPSCGIKLFKRAGKSGPFWGCTNYPKCRTTMNV